MSNTYTYIQSVPVTAEDNYTDTNMRTLVIKDCPPAPFSALNETWNFNLCSQDECYFQPYVEGDTIYRQHNITGSGGTVLLVLYDSVTNLPFKYDIVPVVALNSDLNKYANIQFVAEELTSKCFYYGLHTFGCTPNALALALCIASKLGLGMSYGQAQFECYELLCGDAVDVIYSEPFQQEVCRPTVLVEGSYPLYDCNLNYYGPFLNNIANTHKPSFRVYGEISNNGFTFTETLQNSNKKSSKQIANYLFRTSKIPPYVANQLAVCWNSSELTIDGTVYRKATDLAKNNDRGSMWVINTTVTDECDEISFTCN
jgi:hypothetical protein